MKPDNSANPEKDIEESLPHLDKVLHANRELYDELNKLPEIEAIQAVDDEEKEAQTEKKPSALLIISTNSTPFTRQTNLFGMRLGPCFWC